MRLLTLLALFMVFSIQAEAAQKRVVMLGDSLTSGYGLNSGEDIVSKLQESLVADGIDVKMENAGVSGDTTAGGLSRLEWSIDGDKVPDLVIVALGANDMLRGIDVETTRKNLQSILQTLKDKNIPVLLVGMRAPLNMGTGYRKKYDALYKELADEYRAALYPFFLDGVALRQDLNLPDGIHPNTKGIAVLVGKLKPHIAKMLR